MKIIKFDRAKGIYQFELVKIKTELHSHPAIEILNSKNGTINISSSSGNYKNVFFAIIPANVVHEISTEDEDNMILMIEGRPDFLPKVFAKFDTEPINGIYLETIYTEKNELFDIIATTYQTSVIPKVNDQRVEVCLKYLNSNSSNYLNMIDDLKSKTNLSESRLSHLFKAKMGISLKKYLVWSRLKKAFELVIAGKMNMYEAAIESGFYDQAHLSKAFKQMLGIAPSESYNSRMIQD